MKPYLTVLIAMVLLLTACGSGTSNAQATAALETAIASLLQQSTAGVVESTSAPLATSAPAATSADTSGVAIPPTAGCLPVNTERIVGTVVMVYNGDAAVVEFNGDEHEVRYIGINAPGPNEPGGAEALAANQALVMGKQVLIVMDKTDVDEYGRLPRYVIVDGIFVNLELVQRGFAFHSTEAPDESCKNTLNQ